MNLNTAIARIVRVNEMMKKFDHALSAVAVYIGREIFGNAQIVTIQRKTKLDMFLTTRRV